MRHRRDLPAPEPLWCVESELEHALPRTAAATR